ncbi:MAG: CehA/McbA family metallohydrolase [Steroidobacteraceae bacterium]
MTQRSQTPDVVLTGVVTDADAKTTKHVPFSVPDGVVRLGVELDYTERDQGTVIDTGLFDPDGFRGWSGSSKHAVVLSATDATPAYLPAPIRAGRWSLDLGISAIRPHKRSQYTAKIYFWRHGDTPLVSTFSPEPLRNGPAWYRGDFHMHDAHSDGFCASRTGQRVPCPLYRTVEAAASRKLDFIAITDHNTTSHFNVMRELQPFNDQLLLIPGREITMPAGHANVFGTTEFIDYRLGGQTARTVNDVFQDAAGLHGVITVNHPMRVTSEECRGCGWTAANVNYRAVTAIEVVNGNDEFAEHPRDARAGVGLSFWQNLLDQGLRLTAMGGSDTHDVDVGIMGVGVPTTVVYAAELSERAILDGVRAGHVFVDVAGSSDRTLIAEASAGGASAQMGDLLAAPAGTAVRVTAHVRGCRAARIVVLEQAQPGPVAEAMLATDDETREFKLPNNGARHWLRVEVRGSDGIPVLIGNPFYLNQVVAPAK